MTEERLRHTNGYRNRTLDTRLGSLQLRIPKLRQSSYFPPFLEPRKGAGSAPLAECRLVTFQAEPSKPVCNVHCRSLAQSDRCRDDSMACRGAYVEQFCWPMQCRSVFVVLGEVACPPRMGLPKEFDAPDLKDAKALLDELA
jgi:Transposase, Mutator family